MLNVFAIAFYCAGATAQAVMSFSPRKLKYNWLFIWALPALALHGFLLHHWIDLNSGQNLTESNLFSLATWVTACLILAVVRWRPIAYLNLLLLPLAALSIALVYYSPSEHIIKTAANFDYLSHILLSILTFCVLFLAGLQAITLAVQERFLKQKQFAWTNVLPSIEVMEKILFEMIGIGAACLSLLLITSLYFFHAVLLHAFLQKTVLTFSAWFVFITLLIGRHYFGWRGKKAIYFTLSGVLLLTITYFSSLIIMEFFS